MSVGARSTAAAPLRLLQVLEENRGAKDGSKRGAKSITEEDTFDVARLLLSGQPAGSV